MNWPHPPAGPTRNRPPGPAGWRVHHANIPTHDVRKAAAFYTEILGMQESAPPFKPEDRGVFEIDKSNVGWFEDGNAQVHLSRPDGKLACCNHFHLNPVISGHIAIQVSDLEAVKTKLRARGEYFADAGNWAVLGLKQIYCYDPAMNVVEISQMLEPGDDGYRAPEDEG